MTGELLVMPLALPSPHPVVSEQEALPEHQQGDSGAETESQSQASIPGCPEHLESPVARVATACEDYHNLGVDREGLAYSLPITLSFHSFPLVPSTE